MNSVTLEPTASARLQGNGASSPALKRADTVAATQAQQNVPASGSFWVIQTQLGLALSLPPSLRHPQTLALLADEGQGQPELGLLRHLVREGQHALDLGAGYGLFSLAMAQASGRGRVWAFEPRQAPRAALMHSVAVNGLQEQVQVVPWALAERPKVAHLATPLEASPSDAAGLESPGETVRMDRLDSLLRLLGVGLDIALVKLSVSDQGLQVLAGAKRFFAEQSPTVLLECPSQGHPDPALLDALNGLGYGVFRFSQQLQLLLPYAPPPDENCHHDAPRFLVCMRRPKQLDFAEQGLLVTAQSLALVASQVQRQRSLSASESEADHANNANSANNANNANARHALAYAAVSAAHSDGAMAPAWRVECITQARDALLAAGADSHLPLAAWVLMVHCLEALGQPASARQLALELMSRWPEQSDASGPIWPPLRAQVSRPQSTDSATWLKQMVAEYLALGSDQRTDSAAQAGAAGRAAEDSAEDFGKPCSPSLQDWAKLLSHPDHGAEVERRALLAFALADRCAPLQSLHHLSVGQPACNQSLWRGLIEAMRISSPIHGPVG